MDRSKGRPVLGELVDLPEPQASGTPLPARLGASDVRALVDLTEQWRALGRSFGGMTEVVSPAARRAERLLEVDGPPVVLRELRCALAELHTLAGWCAYDTEDNGLARFHYARALDHAGAAGDRRRVVDVVQHAALADREGGAPNDALKLYQLAQGYLLDAPGEAWVPAKQTWLAIQSASALALLGSADGTHRELARAKNATEVTDAFERADMDHVRAQAYLDLGNLDLAAQYVARSVQTWGPNDRRDGVLARITQAIVHARVGDSGAAQLAATAIDQAAQLRSPRARAKLAPLAHALAASSDSTGHELARRAEALLHSRS